MAGEVRIRSITAPNPGPFTLDGTRTYLLGERVVIDPGPDIPEHLEAIRAAMPHLEQILITHRHSDHAPGAIPLARATGAAIVAPPGVLEEATVHRRVTGGESLDVEDVRITVVATPGHTSDHVCFYTSEGDLFTGDTILGTGTTAIFPPDGRMSDYLESLHVLRALNPKRIHPGHGPMRDDPVALIDEYIAHRLEREQQVLEAARSGAATPSGIRAQIYPHLDSRLHKAAESQIEAHLIKLREEGRLKTLSS